MKRNALTLLGVIAILVAIVAVRSAFEQTIQSEADAEAARIAEENLAEAAEITGDAEATASEADAAPPQEATAPAVEVTGYEEIAWAESAPDVYRVKFDTTVGPFVLECTKEWAPLAHERFYELCKIGYFNGSGFFRVVPGFVVQFGLAADPKMTAQFKNSPLSDEQVLKSNQPGFISFASSGPNSRTAQVFINYGDNANLDAMDFAPFGKVIAGMENVESINAEYGQTPDQGAITRLGSKYLKDEFPNLDFINTVTLVK